MEYLGLGGRLGLQWCRTGAEPGWVPKNFIGGKEEGGGEERGKENEKMKKGLRCREKEEANPRLQSWLCH